MIVHGVQKVFFAGMPVAPQTIAMGDPAPTGMKVAAVESKTVASNGDAS